eukprot:TRINITY_DN10904_c0_g1_i2.p1 TRINITY_DN10904_c0_g1~~TRINITY_DN10904_c0_g1_i2.p1  ORF type:complete len:224 (-),score=31.70 TRINITY_DN10904_c0_g1_i2:155-826(-)
MWSVGCILAELLAKRAIFPGRNEIEQLELIYKICGTPSEEGWPDIVNLPLYKTFKPQKNYRRVLRETFKSFPPEGLDLVDKLLTLDPKKRISASEALDHEYFWTAPLPCEPSDIPAYPTSHEFQAKKRKAQQQTNDTAKRQRTMQQPAQSSSNRPNAAPQNSQGYNQSYPPQNYPTNQNFSGQQNNSSNQQRGGGGGYNNRSNSHHEYSRQGPPSSSSYPRPS